FVGRPAARRDTRELAPHHPRLHLFFRFFPRALPAARAATACRRRRRPSASAHHGNRSCTRPLRARDGSEPDWSKDVETYENGRVRSWASIIDDVTRDQAIHTSALPILVSPLALMPDAHLGQGATIGSVLVTEDAVIPAAVGVDIGCGMAARKLGVTEQQMTPDVLGRWQGAMRALVPAGLGNWHAAASPPAVDWVDAHGIPNTLDAKHGGSRVAMQLGTLGSGNHFVEIAVDEAGSVWLLLHSGSRGAGNRLATVHVEQAKKLDRARAELGEAGAPWGDLAWLESGTQEFEAYLKDLAWAQAYAMEN